MAKEDGRRKLESGVGSGKVQRKLDVDKNGETDPHLRVTGKFGEFSNPECQEGHVCPMGHGGR